MDIVDPMKLLRPVLALASPGFISDIRAGLERDDVIRAVAAHDTPALFDWVMALVPLQGISDAAATSFQRDYGSATWAQVDAAFATRPTCPSLRSYWHFECGYRKTPHICREPRHIDRCPLPLHPLRKGVLNEAAYALMLFFRDVAAGDFVAWIDARLAMYDPGLDAPDRAACMRIALLEPLGQIRGFGPKIWAMILADLLLAADPARERWTVTGASMVAVDSLVHAWLHRSGILRRVKAEHAYGPACTAPRGCVEVIEKLAAGFDARAINPIFPANFPRMVQHAIWAYCAQDAWDICNGNRCDDDAGCRQRFCPVFGVCARLPLRS